MNHRQIWASIIGFLLMLACLLITPNEHRWLGPFDLPVRSYDLSTLFVLWLILVIVIAGIVWTFSTGHLQPTSAQQWAVWISAVIVLLTALFPSSQSYFPFGSGHQWIFLTQPLDCFSYVHDRAGVILQQFFAKAYPAGLIMLILGFQHRMSLTQKVVCWAGMACLLLVPLNIYSLVLMQEPGRDEWVYERIFVELMPRMFVMWGWVTLWTITALIITWLYQLNRKQRSDNNQAAP